jgi:hypothetical protein
MNAHSTEIAKLRSLPDVVAEYDAKVAAIPDALAAFDRAAGDLKAAACVGGEWGGETIDTGRGNSAKTLEVSLRRSAWKHVWKGLNLSEIASAKDKKLWEQSMAAPPPFTLDNLRATFAPYLENPRAAILRGLAEVFADLDPAYKSHEKVKIGVKGLPKRVILSYYGSIHGHGHDKLRDILNALSAYQGKPLLTHAELSVLNKNGDAMRDGGEFPDPFQSKWDTEQKTIKVLGRGVWLKRFQNGNAHLFFGDDALRDINRALAEFYGDVLPDCPGADEDRPSRRASTEVAKDLQFYPTPQAVIDRVLADIDGLRGKRVLEPSCGDGRIMDALRAKGAEAWGIEVDATRAAETRSKGHRVFCTNFLETGGPARPDLFFDLVVMNPPFYGRHYHKHVTHACRFLKPGGQLVAILPITARTDHGLLGPDWARANGMKISTYTGRDGFKDLPVGSFAESGTNINTTVFHAWKESA